MKYGDVYTCYNYHPLCRRYMNEYQTQLLYNAYALRGIEDGRENTSSFREQAMADCKQFIESCFAIGIDPAKYSSTSMGRDFWDARTGRPDGFAQAYYGNDEDGLLDIVDSFGEV